jgi:hypothetical protein
LKSFYCLALLLSLPTSMVWANITDNQQVDKPVKPVATISRFAKIKNTQPWYQNFNLVVSPAFSGNNFSGEGEPLTDFYTTSSRHTDERSSSVQARLGGKIKSYSIYMRVGYEKNEISQNIIDRKESDNIARGLSIYDIYNQDTNGSKVDFTLFGQHQFKPLVHIGYELYWESHELDGIQKIENWFDCSESYNDCDEIAGDLAETEALLNYNPDTETLLINDIGTYARKGKAVGGRINLGSRYDYNQTQLTINYTYSHERYQGRYFSRKSSYTKLGHSFELAIYHPWQYDLSTELSLSQTYEDSNLPEVDERSGANISRRVSFEVKKLVTENTALSLNYTRINFSDFRQGYDFAAWFLRLDYQFSNDKPPRRRKRHNNLMRTR